MKQQKIDQGTLNEMFNNEDFARMWLKMHTPYLREIPKVGRNDICPFCDSGKKFKNCECYEQYKNAGYTNKVEKEKQFYQQLAADYENDGLENML